MINSIQFQLNANLWINEVYGACRESVEEEEEENESKCGVLWFGW